MFTTSILYSLRVRTLLRGKSHIQVIIWLLICVISLWTTASATQPVFPSVRVGKYLAVVPALSGHILVYGILTLVRGFFSGLEILRTE